MARSINTIIIGGGQAGLATSACLSRHGIDHLILERGRVGERWRSERWDSLRLLTPNWLCRLPGFRYDGADPDGYMRMSEVVRIFERYAQRIGAPIERATVRGVRRVGATFRVQTDAREYAARNVVVATGACDTPFVPALARELPSDVQQIVPTRYRNPASLVDGAVLVVGASASGVQLAAELRHAGRDVVLAVGRHTRLPRLYRGRDVMWWLDAMGKLDENIDEVGDLAASRRQPSLQLVGTPERRTLDLSVLQESGVELVGRVVGARDSRVGFAADLDVTIAHADAKLRRLLARIDRFIDEAPPARVGGAVPAPTPIRPVRAVTCPATIDLHQRGIRAVVWATGFRRSYRWLDVDVLDARGELRHDGGVTEVPGLYAMGLPFMRRRNSSFIDGVANDARDIAAHIAARSAQPRRRAA